MRKSLGKMHVYEEAKAPPANAARYSGGWGGRGAEGATLRGFSWRAKKSQTVTSTTVDVPGSHGTLKQALYDSRCQFKRDASA